MTKPLKHYLFIVIIIFMTGCSPDYFIDPVVVSNVESEFYLDLWEDLSPEGDNPRFLLETIIPGECQNGGIDFHFIHAGNQLTLTINGIDEPEDCIPGTTIYHNSTQTGAISTGIYYFTLNLRNTIFNEGKFYVYDDRMELWLDTEDGIILLNQVLRRVPKNALWGYIYYNNDGAQSQAENAYNMIKEEGISTVLTPGYYGHFTIDDNYQITDIPTLEPGIDYIPVLFQYDGDWENLTTICNDIENAHPEISIHLFNGVGEEY